MYNTLPKCCPTMMREGTTLFSHSICAIAMRLRKKRRGSGLWKVRSVKRKMTTKLPSVAKLIRSATT